jgi:hypothetical protein
VSNKIYDIKFILIILVVQMYLVGGCLEHGGVLRIGGALLTLAYA